MRNKKLAVSLFPCTVVCALVLSACTTEADRRQANHDFDYTSAELGSRLTTPAPLQSPDYVKTFDLTVENRHGDVGNGVDVRPPEQVMPFVTGSRPDTNRNINQIWYSAQSLNQNINTDVWRWTNEFLSQNLIPIINRDDTLHRLDVGPIALNYDAAKPDDIPPTPTEYYRIEMFDNQELHQTGLRVTWLKAGSESPDIYAQQRYSAMLLNRISAYIDQHANAGQMAIAQGPIQLQYAGPDATSQNITSNRNFATTWRWLTDVLPKSGLMLEQQSQAQGLLVFNYHNPNEHSFWSSLAFWRPSVTDSEGLGIKSGKYRLQLAEQGQQTSITFLDDSNKPVEPAAVQRLYQLLQGYSSSGVSAPFMASSSESAVVATQEQSVDNSGSSPAATSVIANTTASPASAASAVVAPIGIALTQQDGRWVAQADAQTTSNGISRAIEPMGFTVNSADDTQLVVHYHVPSQSMLDSMMFWKTSSSPERYEGLGEGNYILQLKPVGNHQTAITLVDGNNKPVAVSESFYNDLAHHLQN